MNRSWLALVITLLVVASAADPSHAQWVPDGVHLNLSGSLGDVPQVVSDGAGGAFVAWRDIHNSDDVYMQRVTASGMIAPGWPAAGLPGVVLPRSQEFSSLAPDGFGGGLL